MIRFHEAQRSPVDELRDDSHVLFELGHDSWRSGICIRLDASLTVHQLRQLVIDVMDEAGAHRAPRLAEPGWWSIMFGMVADRYGPARVERHPEPGYRHVCVLVGARMFGHPDWPMVRFAPSRPWLDLRTEACFRHGPSDGELQDYLSRLGERAPSLAEARRQFELGVLEFRSDDRPGHRRGVRAAGS